MHKFIKKMMPVLIVVLVVCIFALRFMEQYDPEFKNQWYLDNSETGIDIGAKEMWRILSKNKDNNEVVVAIIDTGVNYGCKELADTQWVNRDEIRNNGIDDDKNGFIDDLYGWSFVDDKPFDNKMIESSHGTICAGIIAARHNGKGMEGIVRYGNVKIMPIKVMSSENSVGEASIENVIDGIKYAESNGADICNLSFSTEINNQQLYETIKNSNMLFITSAGNNNFVLRINIDKKNIYPGSYSLNNMITVANMTKEGRLDETSNYGQMSVDVVAPGTDIFCIVDKGQYGYVSGSSFAVPMVAGIAANIYLIDNEITPREVKNIIYNTVTTQKALHDKCSSGGYVNGSKAIEKCMKGEYNGKQ